MSLTNQQSEQSSDLRPPTSDSPAPTPDTVVFKTAGGREIRADVYAGLGGENRPAIVWLHGGALMFGSRGMIPLAHLHAYVREGYAVVAPDYRLAPESKLPEILADVHDAIAWVREEGPRLFGIDSARVALVGHSAGGYLTLQAGGAVYPRPQALVAYYGYGDIVGPWYSEPSPFYCQQSLISADEAYAVVGETPLTGSPDVSSGSPDRSHFYLYCRQRGLWPQAVSGHDPVTDRAFFVPYCPVWNVAGDYPPTLLLHGDQDTDVPYEQSVAMAKALAEKGIAHELITIPGGEHVFDMRVGDPDADAAFASVLAFLDRHLRPNDRQRFT